MTAECSMWSLIGSFAIKDITDHLVEPEGGFHLKSILEFSVLP